MTISAILLDIVYPDLRNGVIIIDYNTNDAQIQGVKQKYDAVSN